jgi:hypothetical protein
VKVKYRAGSNQTGAEAGRENLPVFSEGSGREVGMQKVDGFAAEILAEQAL